jgi:histidinol phosphatase-like enzyme
MIGDKPVDMELIHRVGGRGILIFTGRYPGAEDVADYVAQDLVQAAGWI